jgi:hypothetical protein
MAVRAGPRKALSGPSSHENFCCLRRQCEAVEVRTRNPLRIEGVVARRERAARHTTDENDQDIMSLDGSGGAT